MIFVPVRQDDIDDGEQKSETNCPLARAMNRVFPAELTPVRVTKEGIVFANGTVSQHSDASAKIIQEYDATGEMETCLVVFWLDTEDGTTGEVGTR